MLQFEVMPFLKCRNRSVLRLLELDGEHVVLLGKLATQDDKAIFEFA
jgi:hypothetical protein